MVTKQRNHHAHGSARRHTLCLVRPGTHQNICTESGFWRPKHPTSSTSAGVDSARSRCELIVHACPGTGYATIASRTMFLTSTPLVSKALNSMLSFWAFWLDYRRPERQGSSRNLFMRPSVNQSGWSRTVDSQRHWVLRHVSVKSYDPAQNHWIQWKRAHISRKPTPLKCHHNSVLCDVIHSEERDFRWKHFNRKKHVTPTVHRPPPHHTYYFTEWKLILCFAWHAFLK